MPRQTASTTSNASFSRALPLGPFQTSRLAGQDSNIINKSVFLAPGINIEGQKELPGMWLAENEGAKFWLNVLTELKNRGLSDMFIACVDGLRRSRTPSTPSIRTRKSSCASCIW